MDVSVGQTAYREMQVTAEVVESYARLTGDYNPLHFDEEFASRTRFGRLMAQGGITTGLLHALVAMDMPGSGTVFVTQNWSFTKPVYIGDVIRAEATVKSVRDNHPMADISFVVKNQDDEEVLTGEAVVYPKSTEGMTMQQRNGR